MMPRNSTSYTNDVGLIRVIPHNNTNFYKLPKPETHVIRAINCNFRLVFYEKKMADDIYFICISTYSFLFRRFL